MPNTWVQKPADVQSSWKSLNAEGKPLGRLACEAAKLLIGKHKAQFSPHIMGGDFVIITNAGKVKLTGKKWTQKSYYSVSRYPGSLKEKKAKDLDPRELIEKAVQGMLPKNKHRSRLLKRLKIFKEAEHSYEGRKPEEWTF